MKPHKISAFYLDKQKSFVPKKKWVLVKDLGVNQEVEFIFYCDGYLLALCK